MQVKNITCWIIAFGFASLSACKCNQSRPPLSGEQPVYIYEFEKTAPLTADNTKKLISNFLGDLKTTDLTVSKDENIAYFVSPEDVNTTLEEDLNNGNFAFTKLNNAYLGDLKPQLPAPAEAIKISDKFLRDKGMFPKNPGEFKLVHTGGLRAQSMGGPIIDKMITLTYGRMIDSLQVIGAGSKIVVNVGDKGEVVGMIHRWRELNLAGRKEVKAEEVISQQEAEALAKRQIIQEFGQQATYDIKTITKSYYDNNGSILQPVYAFETVVNLHGRDKDLKPLPYLCVIPILKNSPEPLNLTRLDPQAKENLQTIEQIKVDTSGRKDTRNKD
jgi:hypothetical protein